MHYMGASPGLHRTPTGPTPVYVLTSGNLPFELQRAQAEYAYAHPGQDDDVEPEVAQARTAQHNSPLQLDVVRRRQHRADRVENPGHRLARKDEAGEEHRRQNKDHAQLQRLELLKL